MHLLFVCTGNICRSPMAERLSLVLAHELNVPDFTSSSAGIRAVISHPMHEEARRVLEQLGGDGADFAARQLNKRIASEADLIITMERPHRDYILEIAPRQLARTFTLHEAALLATEFNATHINELSALRPNLRAGSVRDVPDPIGKPSEFFEMVGSEIDLLLRPVMQLCMTSESA